MSKSVKKVIAVLLAAVTAFAGTTVAYAKPSDLDKNHFSDIPVVYVEGQGAALYTDDNNIEGSKVYPISIPDGYIESFLTKDNLKMFAKCYFTNNYDEFNNLICDAVIPLFEEVRLNKKCEAENGSHFYTQWRTNLALKDFKTQEGYYINGYRFNYDFRMDPIDIADELNEYIEMVCKTTGAQKVAAVGRCLGACVLTAYIYKYGDSRLTDVILYSSGLNGVEFQSTLYAGKDVYLDADGIVRIVYDYDLSEFIDDEIVIEFLRSFLNAYNKLGGVKWALNEFNRVYRLVYKDVQPRIMKGSYGTFPGMWAMVNDEDYEDAKNLIFGQEAEEWSTLIEKIDYYHYNVMVNSEKILKDCESHGVNVYNIEKYGQTIVPVEKNAEIISDRALDISKATYGATTTDIKTTFSAEYMKKAEENGTAKYISPDKQIDMSTASFRDTTWMIKNIHHTDFPETVNTLISAIVNCNGRFTVWDDKNFPQYMVYESDSKIISPMTAENCDTTERWNESFFESIKVIISDFKYIIGYIKTMLNI